MEQLILCIITWLIVFLIIPFDRVKKLSIVAVIAFIWMVFVDNASTSLGYYRYEHSLISIGRAPFFQNLVEAGLGIIMINWLKENSLTKLFAVLIVGTGFIVIHNFYIQRGVFAYGSFDNTLNFIHHIAALSIFTWLSLAIVGEQKVYAGNKSRVRVK
jgi:hypothetical protein